ncbi:MAG: arylsulfatase [Kiritimatiellae bacterium]|nr:arylsulfatase [Kiritimatiellia bacterium]MDD5522016.1 arylsulfatase [Kiritimatiellia bacterium]
MSILKEICGISRRSFLQTVAGTGVLASMELFSSRSVFAAENKKPNVVFILADDVGYGDFSCYGAVKIKTPHIDKLAAEGRRFTDAHSPSAVCTPTRYALMTGEYAWRKQGTGILPGIAAIIIEPGRMTLPAMFKQAGYTTAVVGKWHLGLGAQTPTDYNGEIKPGPLEVGFDQCFIIPATGDRTPCVYVENHRVAGLDPKDPIKLDYTVKRGEPRSFVNDIPRIGEQTGGRSALWKDDDIADTLTGKAIKFIEQNKDKPFFLYFATHDIHVPRVPHPRFKGSSQAGVRGDVVQEFDWSVGKVIETIDKLGLAENTIIIVTSDNGGVLDQNGPDAVHGGTEETNNGHAFNGPLRAGKGSAYEGGTRIPFIARWPGKIKPGVSSELICHVDMLATVAELTGQKLSTDVGPDSFNILPALLGEKLNKPCRDHLIEHGHVLAIREGTWKYLPARQGRKKAGKKDNAGPASTGKAVGELYNLAEDIGEQNNVADKNPDIVKRLSGMLEKYKTAGRSRYM